jgi:hypothetical protein
VGAGQRPIASGVLELREICDSGPDTLCAPPSVVRDGGAGALDILSLRHI